MHAPSFIAIDLKSFYASVEAVERGLDPLTANLVVADRSRTPKTICLAVSPALKALGVPGRPRLFEVIRKVAEINRERRPQVEFIVARPRMALYMDYSVRVFRTYLKYVAPADIHSYSIDEVFIDAAPYLGPLGLTARELARRMMADVLSATGVTATAGLGTNLYLAKVAMDIVAKHSPPDAGGARLAELDETGYRRELWAHRPLTDFWRVGRGYARRLERIGLMTMGDVARCSLGGPGDFHNADRLYKMFGRAAGLLIDHAWGVEPCTMAAIKAYRPATRSLGGGQVLHEPHTFAQARLITREMAEQLALDLVAKRAVAGQVALTVGYDAANLSDPAQARQYRGEVHMDRYGRPVPKHGHGTANLGRPTSSGRAICQALMALYDRVADRRLLIRRLNVVAAKVVPETSLPAGGDPSQPDLFTGQEAASRERERDLQKAMLQIRARHGKNAILKGLNFEEGATMRQRNLQIGGHRA